MGKDLKGRELGKGLYQRKDGRYEEEEVHRHHNMLLSGCNYDAVLYIYGKGRAKADVYDDLRSPVIIFFHTFLAGLPVAWA